MLVIKLLRYFKNAVTKLDSIIFLIVITMESRPAQWFAFKIILFFNCNIHCKTYTKKELNAFAYLYSYNSLKQVFSERSLVNNAHN